MNTAVDGVQKWPHHYRDDGTWCLYSEVDHRGDGACPNGCEGSLHHYANDGHPECAPTLACGCPGDTPVRQIDEHDVQCTGCGQVSA